MNKPTMKEFLSQYVENMHSFMADHAYSLRAMNIACDACPFRDQCNAAEDSLTCEEFILARLADGKEYRAK